MFKQSMEEPLEELTEEPVLDLTKDLSEESPKEEVTFVDDEEDEEEASPD
jgi:hypothetical protein